MKNLIISIVSLLAFALLNSAFAAPPHGKANIRHCGCVVDEVSGAISMAYVEVNVSSKAKGHYKHGAGTIDSCFDGVDTYIDFVRTGGDCVVPDGDNLAGTGLLECVGGQESMDPCGEQVPE